MPADLPLAPDLVPILRADRDRLDERCPGWWVRAELWLEDVRTYERDNEEMRAAIAARKGERP